MRPVPVVLLLSLLAPAVPAAAADTATGRGAGERTESTRAVAERRVAPTLRVRRLITGLERPWDVQPLPGGRLIFTQRDRATLSVWHKGSSRTLRFPSDRIWTSGETGLMSVEVDPGFQRNRRVYTCSGWRKQGDGVDVRVVAWRLNQALTRARLVEPLVTGFPTSSGRHGGCALEVTRDGSLLVGTGDAAQGSNPRDKTSLGGKTLRLNRFTGKPWPKNPWRNAKNAAKRYVFTFGHRNVQGLAERRDGTLWSVEQGSWRDDEVNRLRRGGDYGWHPVPGYDESVPMTDHGLPGKQVSARWRSGEPTLATSGATFVYGRKWGALGGALAVGVQKAERVLFLTFDGKGRLKRARAPKALRQYGRLRGVTQAPGGALLVTTDNGDGDAILKVTPRR
ncbi:PQQ-dependent sugar dehydrogenase [Nocardioides ferulae]|uniref:PQQ-dependent sugar dehydrogenase n=1 Tax=Nocardioides ferulae TaxID=2340821 RepID=UPI000EB57F77|nr:PQQ-dependent sugar dehydrogenase [Nocardioides ferulae]